jgi:aldehyde dehydrogenase (NAD+)
VQRGEHRMLIDGKLTEAASGGEFDNVNPTTEEVLGATADASSPDIQRAIAAARRAFDTTDWATNRARRVRCLTQLQEALEGEREDLRAELVAEVGCPLMSTYGPQLDGPLSHAIPWAIEMVETFPWERELPVGNAFGKRSWRRVAKEPVGVVGSIVPWNYPFDLTIHKVADALAAGNTVILKPAPDTPWNGTRLGRLVAEKTDIPAGVFNVVTSSDAQIGEEMVVDPRVDLISFTGSTATGKRIMAQGASTLTRLFLELGGKSAHVVLDDADFAAVMPSAAGICFHGGQGCAQYTRWLVPRSRYDEAIELMVPAFGAVKYGDPTRPDVLQGPQISARQRDRVLGYIEKGVAEGARLVTGGGRPAEYPKGWFVEPTLFADVSNDMTIAREEIFGPVMVVIPFDDDADAVRIANDSAYGLAGAVTSGSEERALGVALQIRAGVVSVNGGIHYGADAPFGGFKSSGIGRQGGLEGFEQYLETKTYSGPARPT